MSLQCLVHHARARTGVAIVQIDDGAVERERLLDFAPERFVGGDFRGLPVRHAGGGGNDAVQPVRVEGDGAKYTGGNDLS